MWGAGAVRTVWTMSGVPGVRARAITWVGLAGVLLGVAYALPTVTYDRVGAPPETYSIYGGIEVLWIDGNVVLASIVFAFSIVFPVGKLLALGAILSGRLEAGRGRRLAEQLMLLGKWSMLDVFVVAGFVGAMQMAIAQGTSRAGIHVFCAAIVVSMVAAESVVRAVGARGPAPALGPRPVAALGSLVALALLVAALATTLFDVRKLLWANHVGLGSTTAELFRDGELGLGIALALFVLALPAARALVTGGCHARGGSPRLVRVAQVLDEWAMIDVFALALGIVWVKLDELTTTHLRAGAWLVLAAAAVGEGDAWLLRRRVKAARALERTP